MNEVDDPFETPVEQTGEALIEARPDGPSAERELRRKRMAAAMFGVDDEPTRFGRFVLLDRIGQGGMGTVHSAYDPQLNRRVALKLLRPGAESDEAQARMLREAQALARLSHPNIVPVHDAGVIDGQVFIVMEFVVGKTLRRWLESENPSWAEVLAIYLEAGRGLAAAHAMGVVHRDFKPDNAILGEDGRVRVLDFGLARGITEPPLSELASTAADLSERGSSPAPISNASLDTLTVTGAVLGTPAYMAPEQFLGEREVGPATDQYGFCSALFEGLYRRRAFAGNSLDELRSSVLLGELEQPDTNEAPRWLLAILRRGLSRAPQARYPSMDALLAELGRDRQRLRKRALAFVGTSSLALAVALTAYNLRQPPEVEQCTGADERVAEVWNDEQRARADAALAATQLPYAERLRPQIRAGLDDYGARWAAMHRAACETHARKEQSDALFDKRVTCLERRLTALRSAIDVLVETTPETLAKAADVVSQLPKIASCAQLDALEAEVPPPEHPELAAAVARERERLIHIEALEHGGRLREAQAQATGVVRRAETLGYDPLLAEALLARGRVAVVLSEHEEASASLERATLLGFKAGVDAVAVEALARWIYAEGTTSADPGASLARVELAEALAERLPDGDLIHALVLNNAGSVELARGARSEAHALFTRALELRDAAGLDELELTGATLNLALLEPSASARAELSARALRELETTLGPAHPMTLNARVVHSHQLDDLDAAIEVRSSACQLYERFHPDQLAARIDCALTLGMLLLERGEAGAAAQVFDTVAGALGPDAPEDLRRSATLSEGYAALARGESEAALALVRELITGLAVDTDRWWIRRELALAQLAMARAHRQLGEFEDAIAALEEAIPLLEYVRQFSTDADLTRLEASARRVLERLSARR